MKLSPAVSRRSQRQANSLVGQQPLTTREHLASFQRVRMIMSATFFCGNLQFNYAPILKFVRVLSQTNKFYVLIGVILVMKLQIT